MLQRAISGLVFVVVLSGAILWNLWSMLGLFTLIAFIGLIEFYKLRKAEHPQLKQWTILYAGMLAFAVSVVLSMHIQGVMGYGFPFYLILLVLCIVCFPALLVVPLIITDMLNETESSFQNTFNGIIAAFYIGIPFGMIIHLLLLSDTDLYNGKPILAFFILIWSNDTFAYLTGKFLGRRKLWERLSPKKTWEGFFGGLLFTQVAMQILIRTEMFTEMRTVMAIGIPLIVSIFGTLGDLSESYLKRKAGVKDSGQIMPGHGGVLDRFDGILLSLPVLGLFVAICLYFQL